MESAELKDERPRVTAIQQMNHAFWQSAVLHAAYQLDLFTKLANGPLNGAQLAEVCQGNPRGVDVLATACVALGLLEKEEGRYRNSPLADTYLVKGKPEYQGNAIAHAIDLWRPWGRLGEVVRTGQPAPRRTVDPSLAEEVHRHFILAMHANASTRARFLVQALDLTGKRQLLDVGGGPGTYSIALCRANPGLKAIIMDLAPTLPIAREIVADAGLLDRISLRQGDFTKDSYGEENDVVLLSAVLHQEEPASCQAMICRSFESMVPGGLVIVQDTLLNDERTGPIGPALFALNMLINTQGGGAYTAAEIGGWMHNAGFHDITTKALPGQNSLVIGVK